MRALKTLKSKEKISVSYRVPICRNSLIKKLFRNSTNF